MGAVGIVWHVLLWSLRFESTSWLAFLCFSKPLHPKEKKKNTNNNWGAAHFPTPNLVIFPWKFLSPFAIFFFPCQILVLSERKGTLGTNPSLDFSFYMDPIKKDSQFLTNWSKFNGGFGDKRLYSVSEPLDWEQPYLTRHNWRTI